MFELDCLYKCSEYCLNEVLCNRIGGRCDIGCDIGYIWRIV